MTMVWVGKHPQFHEDMLGHIPWFLDEDDPRPAREQFAVNYIGGWHPSKGFSLLSNGDLSPPRDPPIKLLAELVFRKKEVIRFYCHAWIAIFQKDGSWEVARMD